MHQSWKRRCCDLKEPTKEQWEAQKQTAIQQAKDALLKQVEGKTHRSSAQKI